MKKKSTRTIYGLSILAVIMLMAVGQLQAGNVDFYSDAIIRPGDVYDIVSVYDTPPVPTVVHMFGGKVFGFITHDLSTVNIFGGELEKGIGTYDSSTVNIFGGTIILEAPGFGDSSVLNIYGGDVFMGTPGFSPLATINIYGYDFSYDGWALTGFLSDDSPFMFLEIHPIDDYPHINLIVIPEPATVMLLALGGLFLKMVR